MSVKESTLEAVLERPMHDESGSVPEFDESEWARQMGNADASPVPSDGATEESSLAEALGLPESFEDLWPGFCYQPPKIKELRKLIPMADAMTAAFNAGNVEDALVNAIGIVQTVARRVDGDNLVEVTADEIESTFDENEIADIINHIFTRQGLIVKDVGGNAISGRPIGLRNFRQSVASMPDTDSNTAETSPSPNSEDS